MTTVVNIPRAFLRSQAIKQFKRSQFPGKNGRRHGRDIFTEAAKNNASVSLAKG